MTIKESKEKLAGKIPDMRTNYPEGMKTFFGADVSGSGPVKAYLAKVKVGMEDKWEKNLKRKFGIK